MGVHNASVKFRGAGVVDSETKSGGTELGYVQLTGPARETTLPGPETALAPTAPSYGNVGLPVPT